MEETLLHKAVFLRKFRAVIEDAPQKKSWIIKVFFFFQEKETLELFA